MKKVMDEAYASFDALVAPSRSTVAYPIDKDFDRAYPGVGGGFQHPVRPRPMRAWDDFHEDRRGIVRVDDRVRARH